jgi:5-methylcytosine-specific restriction enzyme B
MSRMLGEAFSLLERDQRGRPRTLPGVDGDEGAMTLTIPEDLYVIGTMNEIDQSVESLDFAFRRRFLWRECPFERETLIEIIESRWPQEVKQKRFDLEGASDQLQAFADRAEQLNAEVAASPELGAQYQIGHTYFADITFFIGDWTRTRRQKPASGTYLWTKSGKAQPPLEDLWSRSLKPLLEQYLAGSDLRDEEVARLGRVLLDA